jgi:hypothetical protein
MNTTQKYNFKVSVNQFHHPVHETFWDASEQVLIDIFEHVCLNLKQLNKNAYTMIELGSNQCYYSLLFKHILGKNKTNNIMVEPREINLLVGKEQFKLNECEGVFYNSIIGTHCEGAPEVQNTVTSITLEKILQDHNLPKIDVLQCDIDGSEQTLLIENSNFFVNKQAEYIFLGTHGLEKHNFCKEFFNKQKYKILLDHPEDNIGSDSLLVVTAVE